MNNFLTKHQLLIGLQYILLGALGIIIWEIYYPGIFSSDSINQYSQAYHGFFEDAHPPLMSILLWFFMKLGLDADLLVLIQCILTILGVRFLLYFAIQFFSNPVENKLRNGIIATAITPLFLVPFLNPLMFFSIIFWKDAWLTVVFIWIVAYLLYLFLNFQSLSTKKFIVHLLLISFISALTTLIRHNAIVILPSICIIIVILGKKKIPNIGLIIAALPLILGFALNPVAKNLFNIKTMYFGNTILASDLKVLLQLYPEIQTEFPIAARHQTSPIILGVEGGGFWDSSTEGEPCPIVECNNLPLACYGTRANTTNINGSNCFMPVGNDNKPLQEEYIRAVTTHPFKYIYMKSYLYWQMLHPRTWQVEKVDYKIYQNDFGLIANERFSDTRAWLNDLSRTTGNKWYFVWVSGIHILWLALNIILIIYSLIKVFTREDRRSLFLLFLLTIPLSYYLSYTLAVTAPDYRYMYPSTLIMQILFISLLITKLLQYFRRGNSISKED